MDELAKIKVDFEHLKNEVPKLMEELEKLIHKMKLIQKRLKKLQISPPKNLDEILSLTLDDLKNKISFRMYNCFKCDERKTLQDIVVLTERELLRMRNFGRHSVALLDSILNDLGITKEIRVRLRKKLQEEENS